MHALSPVVLLGILVGVGASASAQVAPTTPPAPAPAKPTRCFRAPYHGHTAVDRAHAVAKAKVVALRWREIELAIVEQVKGTVATKVLPRGTGCLEETLAVGDTVLVMTDAQARLLDAANEPLIAMSDPRVPSLVAFGRARTPAERTRALVQAIVENRGGTESATIFLAGSGRDLLALDRSQRAALAKAATLAPTRDLAIVLARLRVELAPEVYDRVKLADSFARAIATIRDYEKITDPLRLAEMIRDEADPVRQLAAFERCARISDGVGPSLPYQLRGSTRYGTQTRMLVSWCSKGRIAMATPPPPVAP